MKKRIIAASVLVILLCLAVGLAACQPDAPAVGSSQSTAPTAESTRPTQSTSVTEPGYTEPTASTGVTVPSTQPTTPDHPHEFGEWSVAQEAGCGNPEITQRICGKCGTVEEMETAPATGLHDYDEAGQCTGCDRKVSVGLFYKLNEDGESYTVIGIGSCEDTVLVIPEIHNGKPVTAIREYAFASMGADPSALVSVMIPASVQTVGQAAFAGCDQLTEIHVEEGSEYFVCIESILYTKDTSTLVVYPGGNTQEVFRVPDHVQVIGPYAFFHSKFLKEVILPDPVHTVQAGAFGFGSLERITFGAKLETIGSRAFSLCQQLQSFTVPEENAFFASVDGVLLSKDKKVLVLYPAGREETAYAVPQGVESIAPEAFYGCLRLWELVLPDSLTVIGESAFYDCENLTQIIFGAGLLQIGSDAFSWCTGLRDLNLPEPLEKLGAGAFGGCMGLEELYLPESLQSIAQDAFGGCDSLRSLHYAGTVRQWCQILREEGWDGRDANYQLYCSDMTAYSLGLSFELQEDGTYMLTGIGECTDEAVVVPALYKGVPVTRVGDSAFAGSGIRSLTLPDTVTQVGGGCFAHSLQLESVVFGRGMESLGQYAFSGCLALKEILVAEENAAYMSSDGVLLSKDGRLLIAYPAGKTEESYEVPAGVAAIHDHAFFDCDNLRSVILPAGLMTLGQEAFSDCDGLLALTLPGSVKEIGQEALYDCDQLSTIYFGGTQEQWKAVSKGYLWDANTPEITVSCSDGDLELITWTVIGTISGDDWTLDIPMVEQPDGTWITANPVEVKAGDQFRCRQGGDWDEAFPEEPFVVETDGLCRIQLDPNTGRITLFYEPVEE